MKPENIAYLNSKIGIWITFKRAQFIQHLDNETRENLLRIVREEFSPTYLTNLWCSECVIEMIKFVFTQYEKYLAERGERIVEENY